MLHLHLFSFSYKLGLPTDLWGDGGGFVFDCRFLHNPGRYDTYKSLTGLDNLVVEFLEREGESAAFLLHVNIILDTVVNSYIRQNYNHLMVSFGCTGGRHRSVYCAEQTARYLSTKHNISLTLIHRELK